MRMNVKDADANYLVLLDGEHLPGCYYADEELGVALCFDLRNGLPYANEARTDAVRLVRHGKVQLLRLSPGAH